MLERFVRESRAVAARARDEARTAGSGVVEAEHVLLALAGDGGLAGGVLTTAGLGREGIEDALDAELARSLAGVGVGVPEGIAPLPVAGDPRWGASAKRALEGALEVARERGDRRVEPAHVLLAILAAREGTVPRALRLAGVDPEELAHGTHAALEARRTAA